MPKAVIAGAGIAGLSAATALRRAGWQVAVYEQAAAFAPLGAALSLWPNAMAALERLGMADRVAAAGAPLRAMLLADWRGKPIIARRDVADPAVMITRARLHETLMGALDDVEVVLNAPIQGVRQDQVGVFVSFTNGDTVSADLLIDAGGIRSPIAAAYTAPGAFRGYGGVLALSEAVSGPGLDGLAAEYWGWGERVGVFELPDHRRYWFYMADQPPMAPAPTHAHIAARMNGWPDSVTVAMAATPADRLIPVRIHAKSAPKSLGQGRVISVGDAAHAMEPNLGQGACQAIEDAAMLGMIARQHRPEDILALLEKNRLKRVGAIVNRAAEGKHGAHGLWVKQAAMRTLMRNLPASITERIVRSVQTLPA